ncbi:MAG: hypothetical protein WDA03_11695 [Trueperaceae bacterium]
MTNATARTAPSARARRLFIAAVMALLALAACIPIGIPGLRNVHGQTWSSRFEVDVRVATTTIRLPVEIALTFSQNLQDVTADATIEYDAGIFRLQTGRLVELNGRIGLDDRLDLDSPNNVLSFEGRFVGDRLIGTIAIAGVVPVGDVTFTRIR